MIYNKEIAKKIAEQLIKIKAVKLSPENPFTWTSGIKSPIYCDNRVTLSDIETRELIKHSFVKCLIQNFPEVELIAGVATAGIPHGMMVADWTKTPFVYVRSSPKGHGLTNQIEGRFTPGQKVVVIEDLVSTGKSSLAAVKALRESGCDVIGMMAVFTYGFDKTEELFADEKCPLWTLSDYRTLRFMNSDLPNFQPEELIYNV